MKNSKKMIQSRKGSGFGGAGLKAMLLTSALSAPFDVGAEMPTLRGTVIAPSQVNYRSGSAVGTACANFQNANPQNTVIIRDKPMSDLYGIAWTQLYTPGQLSSAIVENSMFTTFWYTNPGYNIGELIIAPPTVILDNQSVALGAIAKSGYNFNGTINYAIYSSNTTLLGVVQGKYDADGKVVLDASDAKAAIGFARNNDVQTIKMRPGYGNQYFRAPVYQVLPSAASAGDRVNAKGFSIDQSYAFRGLSTVDLGVVDDNASSVHTLVLNFTEGYNTISISKIQGTRPNGAAGSIAVEITNTASGLSIDRLTVDGAQATTDENRADLKIGSNNITVQQAYLRNVDMEGRSTKIAFPADNDALLISGNATLTKGDLSLLPKVAANQTQTVIRGSLIIGSTNTSAKPTLCIQPTELGPDATATLKIGATTLNSGSLRLSDAVDGNEGRVTYILDSVNVARNSLADAEVQIIGTKNDGSTPSDKSLIQVTNNLTVNVDAGLFTGAVSTIGGNLTLLKGSLDLQGGTGDAPYQTRVGGNTTLGDATLNVAGLTKDWGGVFYDTFESSGGRLTYTAGAQGLNAKIFNSAANITNSTCVLNFGANAQTGKIFNNDATITGGTFAITGSAMHSALLSADKTLTVNGATVTIGSDNALNNSAGIFNIPGTLILSGGAKFSMFAETQTNTQCLTINGSGMVVLNQGKEYYMSVSNISMNELTSSPSIIYSANDDRRQGLSISELVITGAQGAVPSVVIAAESSFARNAIDGNGDLDRNVVRNATTLRGSLIITDSTGNAAQVFGNAPIITANTIAGITTPDASNTSVMQQNDGANPSVIVLGDVEGGVNAKALVYAGNLNLYCNKLKTHANAISFKGAALTRDLRIFFNGPISALHSNAPITIENAKARIVSAISEPLLSTHNTGILTITNSEVFAQSTVANIGATSVVYGHGIRLTDSTLAIKAGVSDDVKSCALNANGQDITLNNSVLTIDVGNIGNVAAKIINAGNMQVTNKASTLNVTCGGAGANATSIITAALKGVEGQPLAFNLNCGAIDAAAGFVTGASAYLNATVSPTTDLNGKIFKSNLSNSTLTLNVQNHNIAAGAVAVAGAATNVMFNLNPTTNINLSATGLFGGAFSGGLNIAPADPKAHSIAMPSGKLIVGDATIDQVSSITLGHVNEAELFDGALDIKENLDVTIGSVSNVRFHIVRGATTIAADKTLNVNIDGERILGTLFKTNCDANGAVKIDIKGALGGLNIYAKIFGSDLVIGDNFAISVGSIKDVNSRIVEGTTTIAAGKTLSVKVDGDVTSNALFNGRCDAGGAVTVDIEGALGSAGNYSRIFASDLSAGGATTISIGSVTNANSRIVEGTTTIAAGKTLSVKVDGDVTSNALFNGRCDAGGTVTVDVKGALGSAGNYGRIFASGLSAGGDTTISIGSVADIGSSIAGGATTIAAGKTLSVNINGDVMSGTLFNGRCDANGGVKINIKGALGSVGSGVIFYNDLTIGDNSTISTGSLTKSTSCIVHGTTTIAAGKTLDVNINGDVTSGTLFLGKCDANGSIKINLQGIGNVGSIAHLFGQDLAIKENADITITGIMHEDSRLVNGATNISNSGALKVTVDGNVDAGAIFGNDVIANGPLQLALGGQLGKDAAVSSAFMKNLTVNANSNITITGALSSKARLVGDIVTVAVDKALNIQVGGEVLANNLFASDVIANGTLSVQLGGGGKILIYGTTDIGPKGSVSITQANANGDTKIFRGALTSSGTTSITLQNVSSTRTVVFYGSTTLNGTSRTTVNLPDTALDNLFANNIRLEGGTLNLTSRGNNNAGVTVLPNDKILTIGGANLATLTFSNGKWQLSTIAMEAVNNGITISGSNGSSVIITGGGNSIAWDLNSKPLTLDQGNNGSIKFDLSLGKILEIKNAPNANIVINSITAQNAVGDVKLVTSPKASLQFVNNDISTYGVARLTQWSGGQSKISVRGSVKLNSSIITLDHDTIPEDGELDVNVSVIGAQIITLLKYTNANDLVLGPNTKITLAGSMQSIDTNSTAIHSAHDTSLRLNNDSELIISMPATVTKLWSDGLIAVRHGASRSSVRLNLNGTSRITRIIGWAGRTTVTKAGSTTVALTAETIEGSLESGAGTATTISNAYRYAEATAVSVQGVVNFAADFEVSGAANPVSSFQIGSVGGNCTITPNTQMTSAVYMGTSVTPAAVRGNVTLAKSRLELVMDSSSQTNAGTLAKLREGSVFIIVGVNSASATTIARHLQSRTTPLHSGVTLGITTALDIDERSKYYAPDAELTLNADSRINDNSIVTLAALGINGKTLSVENSNLILLNNQAQELILTKSSGSQIELWNGVEKLSFVAGNAENTTLLYYGGKSEKLDLTNIGSNSKVQIGRNQTAEGFEPIAIRDFVMPGVMRSLRSGSQNGVIDVYAANEVRIQRVTGGSGLHLSLRALDSGASAPVILGEEGDKSSLDALSQVTMSIGTQARFNAPVELALILDTAAQATTLGKAVLDLLYTQSSVVGSKVIAADSLTIKSDAVLPEQIYFAAANKTLMLDVQRVNSEFKVETVIKILGVKSITELDVVAANAPDICINVPVYLNHNDVRWQFADTFETPTITINKGELEAVRDDSQIIGNVTMFGGVITGYPAITGLLYMTGGYAEIDSVGLLNLKGGILKLRKSVNDIVIIDDSSATISTDANSVLMRVTTNGLVPTLNITTKEQSQTIRIKDVRIESSVSHKDAQVGGKIDVT
ncbi:beta strand repeat-containing protein, partial [Candidatus Sarmatiella mevalonica]|uniref:beta strand repeat-containing protein n=1 Tax=Candidatus Sarmatiella mevalonica TaxID=2770581 RepID=UPI0019230970